MACEGVPEVVELDLVEVRQYPPPLGEPVVDQLAHAALFHECFADLHRCACRSGDRSIARLPEIPAAARQAGSGGVCCFALALAGVIGDIEADFLPLGVSVVDRCIVGEFEHIKELLFHDGPRAAPLADLQGKAAERLCQRGLLAEIDPL